MKFWIVVLIIILGIGTIVSGAFTAIAAYDMKHGIDWSKRDH